MGRWPSTVVLGSLCYACDGLKGGSPCATPARTPSSLAIALGWLLGARASAAVLCSLLPLSLLLLFKWLWSVHLKIFREATCTQMRFSSKKKTTVVGKPRLLSL